jgi:Biopolymer transport protein ExbD/TolR
MRRFAPACASDAAAEPLASINITPLIDVLLVLLVMIILTIPIMAHEVPIDLPQPGPKAGVPQVVHRLAIARSGAVSLDGPGGEGRRAAGVAGGGARGPASGAGDEDRPGGTLRTLRRDDRGGEARGHQAAGVRGGAGGVITSLVW